MVSADFARQFWPGEHAVGHRVRRAGATSPWMTVVGVAGDVMDAGAGVKPGPTLYVPYLQNNTATARVTLVAAVHGDPLAAAKSVRQAIWSVDPDQPVDRIGRLADVLTTSAGDQRFRTVLIAIFAASGLALALVGVYGVTAAAVSARRREAGVRLALGARPALLVARMVGDSMAPVAAGALGGLVVFAAFGRLLSQLLYETSAADPSIVLASVAATLVAAAAAAWLQARLVAQVEPRIALDES
jgi:ABC-type antimicrobial peptide transport system permease subunit